MLITAELGAFSRLEALSSLLLVLVGERMNFAGLVASFFLVARYRMVLVVQPLVSCFLGLLNPLVWILGTSCISATP